MISLFLLLGLSLLLLSVVVVGQKPPLQPLGDVLMMVMDSDKDQKVTLSEVESQLAMLQMLFQEDESGEYMRLLQSVKKAAPKVFELLDVNGDAKLTKKELSVVTQFEQSLKKGGAFRPFVRECFAVLDINPQDDQLSMEEWLAATKKNNEQLSTMTEKFHKIFPLRPTSKELESFVEDLLLGVSSSSKEDAAKLMFQSLDTDKDGLISRQEVGKAYSTAGKKFVEISKKIKELGPMMAMFGGGGGGGGMGDMMNGMKMEF